MIEYRNPRRFSLVDLPLQDQFTENLEEKSCDQEKGITAIHWRQKTEPSDLELRTFGNLINDLKGDTKGFITVIRVI